MLPVIQSNHDVSCMSEPQLNMCVLHGTNIMAEIFIYKNAYIQNVSFLCNIIITIQTQNCFSNIVYTFLYIVYILKYIFLFTRNDAAWTQHFYCYWRRSKWRCSQPFCSSNIMASLIFSIHKEFQKYGNKHFQCHEICSTFNICMGHRWLSDLHVVTTANATFVSPWHLGLYPCREQIDFKCL